MKNTEIKRIKELSHNINTPLTTIMGYTSILTSELLKVGGDKSKVLKMSRLVKKEILKVSKYSKTINKIVSKYLPD